MAEPISPTDTDVPVLYLIDGHAQIFRSYYAIRSGMTSPVTGEPTNAVFAFTAMLLKLFSQFRPHYVVMAIDMPGPTFRDEIYPEYKATRSEPPEDLIAQFDRVFEVTRLFGVPVIGVEGAEADDVIATVAARVIKDPAHPDIKVRIVSKDKDLEQLVGDRVTMFDIHTDTTIDSDTLMQNKGITPAQVIDLLALTGDTADNIPGVPGIGPKTAAALIQEHGSIDGVLSSLDRIKGKRRQNLEDNIESLKLARRLVALKNDIPLEFDMSDAKVGQIDATNLKRLFKELGFRRHITDLDQLLGGSAGVESDGASAKASTKGRGSGDGMTGSLFEMAPDTQDANGVVASTDNAAGSSELSGHAVTNASDFRYIGVTTLEQMRQLVSVLGRQKMLSVDTETIGLGHRAELCGVSVAWGGPDPGSGDHFDGSPVDGVYIPLRSPDPSAHLAPSEALDLLRPVFEDPGIAKCGHNIKYDLLVLRHAGVELRGVAFDSMIAAFLLGMPGRGLDDVSLAVLRHEMVPISSLIGPRGRGKTQKTMDQVPLGDLVPYAAEDAHIALRLFHNLVAELDESGMRRLADTVEMPLIEVLADMEHEGVRVDPAVLAEQKDELASRVDELRDRIHDLAGHPFNLDSPKQLAEVLYKELGLPVVKRTKTGPSTDVEALERLCASEDLTAEQIVLPTLMVEYRQLAKLLSTYLDNLRDSIHPDTGRVHATFNQTGAATGRLSSTGPNLQNIPIRTEVGRRIRRAFVAGQGPPELQLICADYSQIELRVLAHLSEDPGLIEAFENDQDIHATVAAQVFGADLSEVTREQRDRAKTINFGIIYGISAFGLSRRVDGLDRAGAKELIEGYKEQFPGIDSFLQRCVHEAVEQGYVATILGRRRAIPQVISANGNTRSLGERLAINSVVQGSAADLIKLAMVNLHRRIKEQDLPLRLLLQIHDELVLEAPAELAEAMGQVVREEMEGAMKLRVPLKVDVGLGANWLDAK